MTKDFLTISEAANIFGTSRRTLYRLAKEGVIPAMTKHSGGNAGFAFLVKPADVAKALAPQPFIPA